MGDPAPRVHFEGISKRYPGVQALDCVTFSVAPGSIHAVVGENGAGKSTLMKALVGATRADEGTIHLDGLPTEIANVRKARQLGIAVVYQELSLVDDLSVEENVFLGRWPRRASGMIDFDDLRAKSASLFRSLGVAIPGRRMVGELSVAQRQMVEIARALSLDARVLVLDEPSAVLTPHELAVLFELLRRLAQRGVSVLYVSHRLDEIFAVCQTVTVLRDGRHVSTRAVGEVDRESLIRDMVGRPLAEEFPRRAANAGALVLRVEGLCAHGRFEGVSFEVRAGEVFAITGLVGSGRSSLGRALFGALPATDGKVWIGDTAGPFHSPSEAKRAGVAHVPEDRKRQGLLLGRPLRENVTLAHLTDVSALGVLRPGAERRAVREKMEELRIKAFSPDAAVATLSGGNQQKVMMARWLGRRYRVIILDEPTRGVDVGARVEIYTLINRLVEAGAAVVMITSELPEAIGMADRIAVFAEGRLNGILDNQHRNVSQEALLHLAVPEAGARRQ